MSRTVSTTLHPQVCRDRVTTMLAQEELPETMSLRQIQRMCHVASVAGGWWHGHTYWEPKERNVAELICLMHSELSEAMEGERKDAMDDKLTHRKMGEVELADAIVRICDFAEAKGYDLQAALLEKLAYNLRREDHRPENRAKEGGKAF